MRRTHGAPQTDAEAIESRVKALLLQLQELPGWPDIYLHGGLLMRDVLYAAGWPREDAARTAGVDGLGQRPRDVTLVFGLPD